MGGLGHPFFIKDLTTNLNSVITILGTEKGIQC